MDKDKYYVDEDIEMDRIYNRGKQPSYAELSEPIDDRTYAEWRRDEASHRLWRME